MSSPVVINKGFKATMLVSASALTTVIDLRRQLRRPVVKELAACSRASQIYTDISRELCEDICIINNNPTPP